MPSDAPPSYYNAVTHSQPQVNVTNPSGGTSAPSATAGPVHDLALERQRSNASTASSASDNDHLAPGMTESGRRSMDDEARELPSGWVRCFDPAQEHHFYVDTATKRSIWVHPYDDPEYLQSLPDTHPANPNSDEARAVRHAEEQEAIAKKEGRNWFQRKKDSVIGTKEEREKEKADKKKRREEEYKRQLQAQQEYLKRRQELIRKQAANPSINRYYASNPYGYSSPLSPYSRAGMYGGGMGGYGYGYPGGYGRRGYGGYGGGMGMGMPLLGGLGGGLLLGSAMSGGFGGGYGGYGGGFGGDCGGGFGGGDMGGGGGDGGGGGM
ncbi:uncharacterized protein MKK02DRAFT_39475 [Dioszegia hungarica]|uniref:WW domain-containing protein n=1 Tax=Dioszegia hungarica TaxID=4972 RepID=A0AA38HEZ6_9TREE|nr:uncharacterized protein MKK02DRAFT_39475 [Dioszegia hungarica]KAI9639185.1 hypothetical protein MKK02DRAFT_39475 [Dioszegia hungarica]